MSSISLKLKRSARLIMINLAVLSCLLGGLEIIGRLIYPEFLGHTHSETLSMGKVFRYSDFHGFKIRPSSKFSGDQEAVPYVLIFGDSISWGFGLGSEDIWWKRLESLLKIKGEVYEFVSVSEYGNSFDDNLSNINQLLLSINNTNRNVSKIIYQFNYNDITPKTRDDLKNQQTSLKTYFDKFRRKHLNKSAFMRVAQHYSGALIRKSNGTCEDRLLFALGPYTWTFGSQPFQGESEALWLEFTKNLVKIKDILKDREIDFEVVISPILFQIDDVGYHQQYNYLNYDFTCATIDPTLRLEQIAKVYDIKLYNPINYMKRSLEFRASEGNFMPYYFIGDENHITPVASRYLAESVATEW